MSFYAVVIVLAVGCWLRFVSVTCYIQVTLCGGDVRVV